MNAPDWTREVPPQDEVARLRVPPHSVEAEQSLLGGLLLDCAACWDRIGDLVTEADFYRHEHRLIFGAIAALVAASRPADVITVFEHVGRTAKEQDATLLPYLNQLATCVPSGANARRYAEIVRERSVLRSLIAASDEIATAAFNPQDRGVAQILAEAETRVLQIGQARGGGSYRDAASVMTAVLDRMTELHDRGGSDVVGMATGFDDLDRLTSGLQPGDLVVLAARPSMGKTALAMNIAEAVAIDAGKPVAVFSMEMGAEQLVLRMAGSLGRINAQAMRTARLNHEEWSRLSDASERVARAPIAIEEAPSLTVGEMRAKARRIARELGQLGLVVVDYLQLMSGPSGSEENRATQLGEISRGLKAMAKELRCPVLALSQLNRGVESRSDKRPLMSDLRESGAIEQDADVVAFIYRDDYYNKDSREPGVAEVIVAKQRSGPTGTVRLAWLGAFTRFDSLAPDYEPPQETRRPYRGGGLS